MVTKAAKEKAIEMGNVRFTRRDIREYTGWGNSRLKIHLHRLEEMEYLAVHQGKSRQRFIYELLYGIDHSLNRFTLLKLSFPIDDPPMTSKTKSGQGKTETGQGKKPSGQGVVSPKSVGGQGGVRLKMIG